MLNQAMRFDRRHAQDQDCLDYSIVTTTLRSRRAEWKKRGHRDQRHESPSSYDLRSYRPEERLAECHEQAQTLVEDAKGIPRTSDSNTPMDLILEKECTVYVLILW